jgi:hypothetical protein
MNVKKIIISLSLLFVYTLSFSHSLVIHDHSESHTHSNSKHSHEHHSHDDTHKEEGEHITHNDHCDEGIIDLLICMMDDFGQHHNDCKIMETDVEAKRIKLSSRQHSKTTNLTNFNTHKAVKCVLIKEKKQGWDNQQLAYTPPFLSQTSKRGPPIKL